MGELFQVVTSPLKKIASLLFSLNISLGSATTNLGSLIIVGSIFVVLIAIITHAHASGRLSSLVSRLRSRKDG